MVRPCISKQFLYLHQFVPDQLKLMNDLRRLPGDKWKVKAVAHAFTSPVCRNNSAITR